MSQPVWKTINNSDYSRLQKDLTEVYSEELEIVQETGEEYEDEEGFTQKKFLLWRFPIDRLKLAVEGDVAYLVSGAFEESWGSPQQHAEWFDKDLQEVARSNGTTAEELVAAFTSADPLQRALAYEAVGSHYGYDNFDSEPQQINEPELDELWSK